MKRSDLLHQSQQEARRYRLIRTMSEMDSLMLQLGAKGASAAARIQSLELPANLRTDLHDLRELRNRLAHEDDEHPVQTYELERAEGESQQTLSSLCLMLWMDGQAPQLRQINQPGREALLTQAREMGLTLGMARHEQRRAALEADLQLWKHASPARTSALRARVQQWAAGQWALIQTSPLGPHSPLRGPLMQALPLSLLTVHTLMAGVWMQGIDGSQAGLIPTLMGAGNATLHLMVAISLLAGILSPGLRGRLPALMGLWLGHLLLQPNGVILLLELLTALTLVLRAEQEPAPREAFPTARRMAQRAEQALKAEAERGAHLRALIHTQPQLPDRADHVEQKTSTDGTEAPQVCQTTPSAS